MSSYNESETERLLKIIKDKTGMDLSYRNDTVKVSTVYIKKGIKYLSDAGYQDLPSNAYINKQITGVGGTSIAIENDVNYVIVVPNVRLIKNKLYFTKRHEGQSFFIFIHIGKIVFRSFTFVNTFLLFCLKFLNFGNN